MSSEPSALGSGGAGIGDASMTADGGRGTGGSDSAGAGGVLAGAGGVAGAGGTGMAGSDGAADSGVFYCVGVPAGTVCGAGACVGAAITGRYVCDAQGRCVPGPDIVCAPFACDSQSNTCLGTCARDTDCSPGWACLGGSCGLRSAGAACSQGAECASGFCVDGVCCTSACTGACVSCAVPAHVGTCTPVWAGALDPRGLCLATAVETCGRNGTCDGVGGCANYPAGTACGVAGCRDNVYATAAKCNGVGTCVRATNSCSPFACDAKAAQCRTVCATDQDCAPGQPCLNGSCGAKEGVLCTRDAECVSGICSQGVCCRQRCDGACQSCALPGTIGECSPISAVSAAQACVASQSGTN